MIEGYIGRPGSGKSLSMTVRAFKERWRYDEILTNYSLKFPKMRGRLVPFNDANDLMAHLDRMLNSRDRKRRLLLLDEVHLLFDARMWSKVPAEFLRFLAQPRKAGLDMLYTAQHESQVEKRLRTVTNYLWQCSCYYWPWSGPDADPFMFKAVQYDSFEFRQIGARPIISRVYRFKQKYGNLYDTMEVLDRMSFEGVGTKVSQEVAP